MANLRRHHQRRPAATPLAALCAALFVVLTLVAPVLANEGSTDLVDPSVSPRTGTPSTTISFEVSYRNREGSPADHVSVVIDGTAHEMASDGTTTWKKGVVHHWSTKLPVGTHAIVFEGAGRDKFTNTLAAGTVTITAPPSSTPDPTPKPTPKPTPDPTPDPTPRATPRPTPAPDPTSDPTNTPGSTPTPDPADPGSGGTTPSVEPSSGPGAGSPTDPTGPIGSGSLPGGGTGGSGGGPIGGSDGTGATGGPDWSDGSGDGSGRSAALIGAGGPGLAGSGLLADPADDPGATDPTSGTSTDGRGAGPDIATGGPSWGALASALAALGIDRSPTVTNLPMLIGTGTAMTMAFAFAIFGKKRRDEQPPAPDEVLQANAARGHGGAPGSEALTGVVHGATVAPPLDLEAGMPRWRRPSLIEARKADPARSAAPSHRMSFDDGVVAVDESRERRIIRYAVVRLLDAPDELRSAEIGQLDQGDEVQLIEKSGSYWLVLCPDGRQGWLHRMTLGEIINDASAFAAGREIDDDVLAAFLSARAARS